MRWGSRSNAALLALAAHAPIALLLWLDDGSASRPVRQESLVRAIAITLLPLEAPATSEATDPAESGESGETLRPGTPNAVPPPAMPSAAITLPAPEESSPTALAAPREIDWYAQAGAAAARHAEQADNPGTFSGPIQKMREPCNPRKSSFWAPLEGEPGAERPRWEDMSNAPPGSTMIGSTRVGIVPLKNIVRTIAILTGKERSDELVRENRSEPNRRLFDDMKAGATPDSSVPDTDHCD